MEKISRFLKFFFFCIVLNDFMKMFSRLQDLLPASFCYVFAHENEGGEKTTVHVTVVKLIRIKWVMIDMQGKYVSWHSLTGINRLCSKIIFRIKSDCLAHPP